MSTFSSRHNGFGPGEERGGEGVSQAMEAASNSVP